MRIIFQDWLLWSKITLLSCLLLFRANRRFHVLAPQLRSVAPVLAMIASQQCVSCSHGIVYWINTKKNEVNSQKSSKLVLYLGNLTRSQLEVDLVVSRLGVNSPRLRVELEWLSDLLEFSSSHSNSNESNEWGSQLDITKSDAYETERTGGRAAAVAAKRVWFFNWIFNTR